MQELSGVDVPKFDGVIVGCRDDVCAALVKGDRGYCVFMTSKGVQELSGVDVPKFDSAVMG